MTLVHAIICLLLTLSTTLAFGNPKLEAFDKADYTELITNYQNIPESEKELIALTMRDLKTQINPALNSLILGASQEEIRNFTKALQGNAHPEDLENLLRSLNKREGTYIKFMDEIAATVQKDPRLKAKIKARLDQLSQSVSKRKAQAGGVGVRFLNSALMIAGFASAVYGFEMMLPPGERPMVFHETGRFLSTMLLGYIGVTFTGEIVAMKVAWAKFKAHQKEKREDKKIIAEFKKIVDLMSSEAVANKIRNKFRFVNSKEGEAAARAAVPQITEAVLKEIRNLSKNNNSWNMHRSFVLSEGYQALISELQQNLTEAELKELLREYATRGFSEDLAPFEVNEKLAAFERKTLFHFKAHLDYLSTNSSEEVRIEAMRLREKYFAQVYFSASPGWRYNLSTTSSSIALAILGTITAVGNTPTPSDALFIPELVNWIRENPSTLFKAAGILSIPGLFFLHEGFARFPKKFSERMSNLSPEEKLANMDRILQLTKDSRHLESLVNDSNSKKKTEYETAEALFERINGKYFYLDGAYVPELNYGFKFRCNNMHL